MPFEITGSVSMSTAAADQNVAQLSDRLERLTRQLARVHMLRINVDTSGMRQLDAFDRRLRQITQRRHTVNIDVNVRQAGGGQRALPPPSGGNRGIMGADPWTRSFGPGGPRWSAPGGGGGGGRGGGGRGRGGFSGTPDDDGVGWSGSGWQWRGSSGRRSLNPGPGWTEGIFRGGVDFGSPESRGYNAAGGFYEGNYANVDQRFKDAERRREECQRINYQVEAEVNRRRARAQARAAREGYKDVYGGVSGGAGGAGGGGAVFRKLLGGEDAGGGGGAAGAAAGGSGMFGLVTGAAAIYGIYRLLGQAVDLVGRAITTSDDMRRASLTMQAIYQMNPYVQNGQVGASLFNTLSQTAITSAGVMTRGEVFQMGRSLALGGATGGFSGRATQVASDLEMLTGKGAGQQFVSAIEQVIDTEELNARNLQLLRRATGLPVEQILGREFGISPQEVTARAKTGQLLPFTSLDAILRATEKLHGEVEGIARGSAPLMAARMEEAFDQKIITTFGNSLNAQITPALARIYDQATMAGGAFDRWGPAISRAGTLLGTILAYPVNAIANASEAERNALYGDPSHQFGSGEIGRVESGTERAAREDKTGIIRGYVDATKARRAAGLSGSGTVVGDAIANSGPVGRLIAGLFGAKGASAAELDSPMTSPQFGQGSNRLEESLRRQNLEQYIADACAPIVEAGIIRSVGGVADEGSLMRDAIQSGDFNTSTREWQGPQAMVNALGRNKVASSLGTQAEAEAALAQGQSVGISTPGHWLLASGYDPATGTYNVGSTGEAFVGGSSRMTKQQIEAAGSRGRSSITPATFVIPGQGSPVIDKANKLRAIEAVALANGLSPDAARAAAAIAISEGGMGGAAGDNGQSFGDFQLYEKGELPGYAAATGQTVAQAKAQLRANPSAADDYALHGYLGQSLKKGEAGGYHGAALATYGSQFGQRAVAERAGNAGAAYGQAPPVTVNLTINGADLSDQATRQHIAAQMVDAMGQELAGGVDAVDQNSTPTISGVK